MNVPLSKDLETIGLIEEKLGISLVQLALKDIINANVFKRGFFINENGEVTGLRLEGVNIKPVMGYIQRFSRVLNLSLRYCRITDEDIFFLSEWKGLTFLNLSYNSLVDVSFLGELKGLKYLDLKKNNLKDVSFLKELGHLTHLDIDGNPIENPPPGIVNQGTAAVRNYFRALKEIEGEKPDEVKQLLPGDEDLGKTFFSKQLKDEPSILSNGVVKPGDRKKEREITDTQDDDLKRDFEELKRVSKEIDGLEPEFQKEENLKKLYDEKAGKQVKRSRWRLFGFNIAILITWGVFTLLSDWSKAEKWISLVGLLVIAFIVGILVFSRKFLNSGKSRARDLEREKEKQYVSNRFSMDEYERIKNELENARKNRRRLL
jgi:hypothetical protein